MIILEDLKVVDVKLALELMGGYEQVYEKVIQSFLENQSHLVSEVKALLNNDLDEARRLVHSCKGISQNLGSKPLYDIALPLEKAIIDRDQSLIQAIFPKFEKTFGLVIEDLKKIKF